MTNLRYFHVSHELFSGFNCVVDLDKVDSIQEIVNIVYNELLRTLKKHDFIALVEKLKDSKFHIHDVEFGEILISEPETIYYICDHC